MAGVINRLSELVSNQIAAGEVVQRPASVVKELMENAIDAGSESVSVSVINGGKDEIQVYDEGCGMYHEDTLLAFERHATSKIKKTKDLYSLSTFGFRGEALPSIASVSDLEMRTCHENSDLGTVVHIRGGEVVSCEKDAVRKGTQFIIRNLFYNVPARRRSLEKKSDKRELTCIKNEFIKIALCYPRLSFFLFSNRGEVYNLSVSNLRRRVGDIMGKKVTNSLLEMSVTTSIVEIKGYIGNPDDAKKSAEEYFFVNKRYFKSDVLHNAIMKAYDNLLPEKTKPQYFLYFEVKPDRLDVNIHPSKIEVNFDDEADIAQILTMAVKNCLGKNGIVPLIDFSANNKVEATPVVDSNDVEIDLSSFNYTHDDFNPFNESFSFSKAVGTNKERVSSEDGNYYASSVSSSKVSVDFTPSFEDEVSDFENTPIDNMFIEEVPSNFNSIEVKEEEEDRNSDDDVVEIESQTLFDKDKISDLEICDVVAFGEKYIIAICYSKSMFIDVRRAMSRILFDRFSRQLTENNLQSQKMLFPIDVSLSKLDKELIDSSYDDLVSMGFEIKDSPIDGAISVTSVPIDFNSDNINSFFEMFLTALKSDTITDYDAFRHEALVVSLVNSITSSRYDLKTKEEMRYVVDELLACENFSYTPNGKRIIVEVSSEDIRNMLS